MYISASILSICSILSMVNCLLNPQVKKLEPKEVEITKHWCGMGVRPHFKVRNATLVLNPKSFPWAVQVVVENYPITNIYKDSRRVRVIQDASSCSGSLISPRHVITAAHCIFEAEQFLEPDGKTVEETRTAQVASTVESSTVHILSGVERLRYDVRTIFTLADPMTQYPVIAGDDFAILELKKAITEQEFEGGKMRPICFTSDPKRSHSKFEARRTLAAFGGDFLRYQDDIELKKNCPTDLRFGLVKCYKYKGPKPIGTNTAELGDSGGSYIVWEKGTNRAYLDAVLGGANKKGIMYGINVPQTGEFRNSPLAVAQERLEMLYQIH